MTRTPSYQKQRVAICSNQLIDVQEDLMTEGGHIQMAGHVLDQLQQPGAAITPRTVSPRDPALAHRRAQDRKSLSLRVTQERQGALGVFDHDGSKRPVELGSRDFASGRAGTWAGNRGWGGTAVVQEAKSRGEDGGGRRMAEVCGGRLSLLL